MESPVSAEQASVVGIGKADEPEVLHRVAGYRRRARSRLASYVFRRRGFRPRNEGEMSKKTKKRKLKARRNKANHGKRPLAGRR